MHDKTSKDISKILLDIQAITLNPAKPYKFVSGILSPIYCDNRLILSHPDKRSVIIKAFLSLIKHHALEFDTIAGVATSGIPYAALIADALSKPMIYVRADAKEHGKGNVIEGKLEPGKTVLIVEDLISTGKSSLAAVDAVRNAGGIVNDCIAIFTYNFPGAIENFKEHSCSLHTLSNFEDLIAVALETGYLKKTEVENVLAWNKHAQIWGQ